MPANKLVQIDESRLTSMANNELFRSEFPFLSTLQGAAAARKKAGCRKCKKSNVNTGDKFSAAKAAIAGMGDAAKRRLKELLDTKHARVVYRNAAGKVIQLTF